MLLRPVAVVVVIVVAASVVAVTVLLCLLRYVVEFRCCVLVAAEMVEARDGDIADAMCDASALRWPPQCDASAL